MKTIPKPKKEKKVTDKNLLKLWADVCKERANYKCEYPDCDINYHQVHAHHFFSRRHTSIRYDYENSICLCPVHHTMGSFSAHNDPSFKDRILACGVRSMDWYDRLTEKRNRIIKNNQDWKDYWFKKLSEY